MSKPVLRVLHSGFTIHRFHPSKAIPPPVFDSSFYWVSKTDEELSVVCDASIDVVGGEKNTGWSCFKVCGPIDFSVTGVLAGISAVLASEKISIFAVSTFDTDYILVPTGALERAKNALIASGYGVLEGGDAVSA